MWEKYGGKILRDQDIRPHRSILFVPASNNKAIEKIKGLNVDGVIFDLEDAVAPEMKQSARANLIEVIKGGGFGRRKLIIRTNGIETPWFEEDIGAAVTVSPDAILVPKVSSKAEVLKIDEGIRAKNGGKSIDIWAMIETPRAILDIFSLCSASESAPLKALILGPNDLSKETGSTIDLMRTPFYYALSAIVYGARTFGLIALDGVYNDINDNDGLEIQCRQGKDFGFDGKTLIHPNQIECCNKIFAPSDEEIANALAVIDAFAAPENAGKGALKVNGKLAEILHLEMAKKTMAIAQSIANSH